MATYTVKQIGRVYRSNGVATGVQGVINGLSEHYVKLQIENAMARGDSVVVTNETTGETKCNAIPNS